MSVEKELAQAVSRADTQGMTDSQATHAVLTESANRYLARQMCWVFSIEEIDAYLLVPRDSAEVDLLVDTIRPAPGADDVDVVIGVLGDLAAPDRCNGLALPEVGFEQIYSFDTRSFLDSIPRPPGRTEGAFQAAAQELLRRVLDLTDNTGSTNKHRALDYLTMRYPEIYSVAAEQFAKGASRPRSRITTCTEESPQGWSSPERGAWPAQWHRCGVTSARRAVTSPRRAGPRRDRPGTGAGRSCRGRLATPPRRRRSPR